jgi:DNA-binding LytR/AlgR family response regulator
MILNLEQDATQRDIEVSIKYPGKNKIVERLISFVNSLSVKIEGYIEGSKKQINVSDIYYIESSDKIAIVFCEKGSYRTKYRLYQIYEKIRELGFVQISKYCLLNINKLDRIKPLSNRHMEAILINGKKLSVTRKYLYDIKRELREIIDEK